MSAVYQIRTYTPAGVLTNVVTNFRQFAYTKGVNEPGMLSFTLDIHSSMIDDMELDAQVEVWRRDLENGIDWYCDFYGLWRGEQRSANEDGTTTYTAFVPGQMSLLARPIVAFYAGQDRRSAWTNDPAETVAKDLVKYNATASAVTTEERIRDNTLTGITIEADGGGGNTIDFACAWRNLLSALQEVAQIGGGDFDLVKTGARAWEFRWYDGQLGTDRSATLTFALQFGNMANPVLVRNSMDEKTVAIVGGQGEETARTVVVRTGTNYDAAENDTEVFVDARDLTVTASLNARGDVALDEMQTRNQLTFDVIQIPSARYGVHYNLGDLVTGYYQGISAIKKIQRVTVSFDNDGKEVIKVELTDA